MLFKKAGYARTQMLAFLKFFHIQMYQNGEVKFKQFSKKEKIKLFSLKVF